MKYVVKFKDGRPSVTFEAATDQEANEKAHEIAWAQFPVEDMNDFVTHPAYMYKDYYSVHAIFEEGGD